MGKGTIVSGGAEGLYRVTLNLARERIQARIALAQTAIANLETLIAEADAGLTTIDAAILALRAQISDLEEDPVTNKDAIETALNSLQAKLTERAAAGTSRSILVLQKAGQEKRIQTLQALPADPTVDAWCCDLTEDLTGEVGTIEVPGERGTVLIRPGYNGGAVYNHTRDGQLFHPAACTAAGAFFNFAVLPGWQKWEPTYRTGKITALSGDICSLDLDTALSSACSLNVNQTTSLENVPISYMECNGAAFAVDDSVIVEFTGQDWTAPRVIGFTCNPKPCGKYVIFQFQYSTATVAFIWDPVAGAPAVIPTLPSNPIRTNNAAYIAWRNARTTSPGEEIPNTTTVYNRVEADVTVTLPTPAYPNTAAVTNSIASACPEINGASVDTYAADYHEDPPPTRQGHENHQWNIKTYSDYVGFDYPLIKFPASVLRTLTANTEYLYVGWSLDRMDYVTGPTPNYATMQRAWTLTGPFGEIARITTDTRRDWMAWYDHYTWTNCPHVAGYTDAQPYQYTKILKNTAGKITLLLFIERYTLTNCQYDYIGAYRNIVKTPATDQTIHVQAQCLHWPEGYANEALLPHGNNATLAAKIEETIRYCQAQAGAAANLVVNPLYLTVFFVGS